MLTSFKRTIKSGYNSFFRNFGLSLAEVLIVVMVIFLFTFIFAFNEASQILISEIEKKVDVAVYFKEDTAPSDIFSVQSQLSKIPEVKDVQYVSKDDALNTFIEKHKNEQTIIDSLKEIGVNPFLASLNVKAFQASQYEGIQIFLDEPIYKNLIDNIDYFQRKPIIDKIFTTTRSINRGAAVSAIILVVISIIVALTTIRISVYNSKDEISTMRLVGASNWFIRGPFLIQGIIAGLISVLVSFSITFFISYFADSGIKTIAPEISSMSLFLTNFWILLLLQLAVGLGLGVVSSAVGVRKYLKV